MEYKDFLQHRKLLQWDGNGPGRVVGPFREANSNEDVGARARAALAGQFIHAARRPTPPAPSPTLRGEGE